MIHRNTRRDANLHSCLPPRKARSPRQRKLGPLARMLILLCAVLGLAEVPVLVLLTERLPQGDAKPAADDE